MSKKKRSNPYRPACLRYDAKGVQVFVCHGGLRLTQKALTLLGKPATLERIEARGEAGDATKM